MASFFSAGPRGRSTLRPGFAHPLHVNPARRLGEPSSTMRHGQGLNPRCGDFQTLRPGNSLALLLGAFLTLLPAASAAAGATPAPIRSVDRTSTLGAPPPADQTPAGSFALEADRVEASTQTPGGIPFTTGNSTALRFGVHEIALTGNGAAANPFDTVARVTFLPPSGAGNAKTVDAFFDGGNTWRARVYVNETGAWQWSTTSADDPALDGKSGNFTAKASSLRGILKKHATNPKAWMTDDGHWFANVGDTGYLLFHDDDTPMWQKFVRDSHARGITTMRVGALGAWGGTPGVTDNPSGWIWNDPWEGGANPDYSRFDLSKFQNTDQRMIWILDTYPDFYLQMILFSLKGYGSDGTGLWWFSIDPAVRTRTMRYMIARWSAFPNLFWLIENDMSCGTDFPNNMAFAREVGTFFAANEPWPHLMAAGPTRFAGYPFTSDADLAWSTYAYIEDGDGVGGFQIPRYGLDSVPVHVYMGEDWYEQDYGHYADPKFYFRWLYWSWLIAGGSANYCGRWGVIDPYTQTYRTDLPWVGADGTDYTGEQLHGLDTTKFIVRFFQKRGIDLGQFQPDDTLVTDLDGRRDNLGPKATHRLDQEILVYHPNAVTDNHPAVLDTTRSARMEVDLTSFTGTYQVSWYRPRDGRSKTGGTVTGGAPVDFTSPWKGSDAVLRLLKKT